MTALLIAIIAIICDVLGFVIPGFGLWFSIAGFVLAIIAYVTGKNALKANPNDGKAKAGKILGLIFMILGIIAIVFALLAVLAFFSVASMLAS